MTTQYPRWRTSLRYPGYDYAQPGVVVVTICTDARQHLFGTVREGSMVLSGAGTLARERWQAIPARFPMVEVDTFVVMPDHLHGLLFTGTDPDPAAARATVGEVVRWFKASVYRRYREGVRTRGWPPYDGALWQPDYHDRIVRTDRELATIRAYIEGNRGRWWEKHGNG